jgi:hypothetical protein
MYYRVAIQADTSTRWRWCSTVVSSLDTLFRFLRLNYAPLEHLLVFSSGSCEELDEQLARENQGLPSKSVTAAQFLRERMIRSPEGRWRASESGTRGIERKESIPVAREQSLNESSWGPSVLNERGISVLEKRRVELERGAGADNDAPYRFTLPTSLPQVLAWMRLRARVQDGELQL